jgi:hypothetical protein
MNHTHTHKTTNHTHTPTDIFHFFSAKSLINMCVYTEESFLYVSSWGIFFSLFLFLAHTHTHTVAHFEMNEWDENERKTGGGFNF